MYNKNILTIWKIYKNSIHNLDYGVFVYITILQNDLII